LEQLKIECGPAFFRGQAGDAGSRPAIWRRFSPVSSRRPSWSRPRWPYGHHVGGIL